MSGNRFVVPCDVVQVWKQIKNKEFDAYHKKASWVWKCLYWTEEMYAITPLEIMQQVVNVKKGMKLTQAEIIELFDHFPQDLLWTDRVQDIFVNLVYSDGDVSLEELSREQAGKGFYIPTEAEIEELYSSAVNGTRMLVNRGHTPSEVFAMSKTAPGQMPRIIPGSSQAAEMLREAAPEIRKMGFDLDLESNAATVPVMGFPDGINGQAVVTEKKLYPNDPCPCGSGKKYKKCCGKGN